MEYILFVKKKKILKMVHACLAYQVMESQIKWNYSKVKGWVSIEKKN